MRLSSQGTKFYIGTVGVAGAAVLSISKAAPPLLTWTTIPVGLANNDSVVPKGFTWKSIDNRVFKLSAVGAPVNTAKLTGADTTNELNAATLGTLSEITWGESCMATITVDQPAGTTIDVTTLCDAARETIDGLAGISTWQATGFWDASDPMQATLRALYRSNTKVPFEMIFNDGSGIMFIGTVNQFNTTVGVDQAVAFTVGGNISGPITDLPVGSVAMAPMEAVPMQDGQPMLQPAIQADAPQPGA